MLYLSESPAEIIIAKGTEELVVSRSSGEVSTRKLATYGESSRRPIVGLLGVLDLPFSKYLVLATKSEYKGLLLNTPVYQIVKCELLPIWETAGKDDEYLRLAQSHLDAATLFYSVPDDPSDMIADLTASIQRKKATNHARDDRFFWNYELSKDVPKQFILVAIYGIFTSSECEFKGRKCQFSLISRRSRFRAGTRYFRRGLDNEGHAANFNETEQVLYLDDNNLYSFVQTRGSVPGVWSEINTLKYKPTLRVGSLHESAELAKIHFDEQKSIYGRQFLVNLVNHSGYELPVKKLYEDVVAKLNDEQITYIYFDFHSECSKMRWDRVSLLLDDLNSKGLESEGYFCLENGSIKSNQSGVVRTNCMDCLDRTNVVQSSIALRVIDRQLKAANLIDESNSIQESESFMQVFRNVWGDNADGVSKAYSGTGALKTDFTRTGKRTEKGALQDFVNSAVRYFKNNFFDGSRQDGFSLVLGEYTPNARKKPFVDRRPLYIQAIPYIMGGTFLVFVLSVLYPSKEHSSLFNSIVSFTFASFAALSFSFIKHNGMQYVNWPKLTKVRFVEWSNGEYFIDTDSDDLKSK